MHTTLTCLTPSATDSMTGVGTEVLWILSCLLETRKGENHTHKVG